MHPRTRTLSRFGAPGALALVLALGVALAGCGSSASPGESNQAPAENAAPQAEATKTKSKHLGLADVALDLALEEASLRADQKPKIEAIKAELVQKGGAIKTARSAFAKQLAAQVKEGKLDRAALAPALDSITAAHEAFHPAEQKALNDLHGVLDAAQRKALVDAGMQRLGDMKGMHADHHERLEQLADELELSDAQRSTIKSRVRGGFMKHVGERIGEHHDHEARVKELGQAFASESFDATRLDVGKNGGPMVQKMTDGMLALVEATLPELDANQRQKLADHLAAHGAD